MKHIEARYRGKSFDSLSSVLSMTIDSRIKEQLHLECFTGRSFVWKCNPLDSRLWFVPFVDPVDGLLLALNMLRIKGRKKTFTDSTSSDTILSMIETWLRKGPVIVGPLDKSKLWNRIEEKYYLGSAYFLLLIAKKGDLNYVVHDPEGCPFLSISSIELMNALSSIPYQFGIFQVESPAEVRPGEELVVRAFINGIQLVADAVRCNQSDVDAISILLNIISKDGLKSRHEASLSFALPAYGLAANNVLNLLSDLSTTTFSDESGMKMHIFEMENLLCRQVIEIAYALTFLRKRNHDMFISILQDIRQIRECLNDACEYALSKFGSRLVIEEFTLAENE